MKKIILLGSHAATLVFGVALGVYFLPVVIAAHSPAPAAEVALQAGAARFQGKFVRDLKDSDVLHWGEGTVSITDHSVALSGELSPGPDYKLYLSPEFVETEADFDRLKPRMIRVGDVRTFHDFLLPLPSTVDPSNYNTVVVWCETFHQFITSAQYR